MTELRLQHLSPENAPSMTQLFGIITSSPQLETLSLVCVQLEPPEFVLLASDTKLRPHNLWELHIRNIPSTAYACLINRLGFPLPSCKNLNLHQSEGYVAPSGPELSYHAGPEFVRQISGMVQAQDKVSVHLEDQRLKLDVHLSLDAPGRGTGHIPSLWHGTQDPH